MGLLTTAKAVAAKQTPTKTVGLLAPSVASAPAPAYPAGSVAWQDLPNLGGVDGYKSNAATLAQLAKLIGYSGDPTQVIGRTEAGAANEAGDLLYENVYGPSAGLAEALQPYRFSQYSGDTNNGYASVVGQDGKSVGNIKLFNGDDQGWMENAVTAVIVNGLTAGLGGVLGGSLGGAVGSGLGLGNGALGNAVGTGLVNGTISKVGGGDFLSGAITGGLGSAAQSFLSAPAGSLTGPGSLDAYAAMDAGYGTAGSGLLGGLPAITANPLPAIESFVAQNPVSMPDLLSGIPEIAAPVAPVAPVVPPAAFNAAADSQAYNQAAGITGSQAASSATVPNTVNLANAGGTMATAGGLQGMTNTAAQAIRDATAGSAIEGTGALSQIGNTVGNAVQSVGSTLSPTLQWMKDNPTLGRLLLGGATSLLASSGGGSSAAPAAPSGPAVRWNSPIQQGLLSPVQQYAPGAIQQQRPAGLLAQGQVNDGAWRYLKG